MKQLILSFLVMFFGAASFAQTTPKYVGVWCQKYDDFTQYLIINKKDQVRLMSVGNAAGEIVMDEHGSSSLGATQFTIQIGKSDIGVVDYKINMFGKLVLIFKNGYVQKYKPCELSPKLKDYLRK